MGYMLTFFFFWESWGISISRVVISQVQRLALPPKEMSHLRFVGSRCFSSAPCPPLLLDWLSRQLVSSGSAGMYPLPKPSQFPRTCFPGGPWVPTMGCPGQPSHQKHRHPGCTPLAKCLLPGPFCELSLSDYSSLYSFQSSIFIQLLVNSSGTPSLVPHWCLFQWQH